VTAKFLEEFLAREHYSIVHMSVSGPVILSVRSFSKCLDSGSSYQNDI